MTLRRRRQGVALAVLTVLFAASQGANGQAPERRGQVGVVSDWTHNHVLYPESADPTSMERIRRESRWDHNWYLRHPEAWWPSYHPGYRSSRKRSVRDWNISLGTATFGPAYDFNFAIKNESGHGSLNTIDQGNGQFLATSGSLTVTGVNDIGTYSLYPGGPGVVTSPSGQFVFDNLLFPFYPTTNPSIDVDGLLFANASGFEVNLWGNGANAYEYDDSGYVNDNTGAPFNLNLDPGGGQTFPSKFVFDVTAAPSCTNDFVVMGIAANTASGGQANIVGVNNLYTEPGGTGFCTGAGPTVKFAYSSGSGQVPTNVSISQTGHQIAYIENLSTGSSYFHVLTLGTTGTNGTSPTASVVPGTGNNAVDRRILLSPDGGVTNQSSTTAAFVVYTASDSNDVAYVTTYSLTGTSSGWLYKIANVFNVSANPTIVWKTSITAAPSSPVYDSTSNRVFFTDSAGRIDYLIDTGASPSAVYGAVIASGTTSENPVIVDSTNQMVYASFNSNGTNAIVVQAPTSMSTSVSVPVGASSTTYGGPYSPDFNNAFYTGTGTPKMYVAGTGSGTVPTLYAVGFSSGVLNPRSVTSTPLATGMADSSPITEFYNTALSKDYLFVGVTNHCVATTGGGTAGCVMSLDVTNGFPAVNAATTALAAAGGTTGIIVDNNSSVNQASSIYYATKSGSTLVKATQSALK